VEIKNLQKKKQYEQWIELDHLLVQVDARREDVNVPVHLKDSSALALKLSKNFQGQLSHDEDQITAYLLFSGNYFCCTIPWSAIWGISNCDEESRVWKEDIPKEVLIELAKARFSEIGRKLFGREKQIDTDDIEEKPEIKSKKIPQRKQPQLKEVEKKEDSSEKKPKRKDPDLKVIK